MRSNQSRITAADIKYLSLPKRKGFDIIEVNLVIIYFQNNTDYEYCRTLVQVHLGHFESVIAIKLVDSKLVRSLLERFPSVEICVQDFCYNNFLLYMFFKKIEIFWNFFNNHIIIPKYFALQKVFLSLISIFTCNTEHISMSILKVCFDVQHSSSHKKINFAS